jgi:hypothetical protein
MGVVYRALHDELDRVVALKVIGSDTRDAPDAAARF